jgi:superfamily II DNA/RNA helicase
MEVVLAGTSRVRRLKFATSNYLVRDIRKNRPDILVCTPGRLIDLLKNENLKLDQVSYQILDEGDKMLDMGFE